LTIIIPLLPLYTVAMGADAFVIGLLAATYPLMQLVGGPFLGNLSDRFGRKPILLVSQLGTFIGFVILSFATTLPLVFLSRFIDGISGANIVVAQAAITDSTTEKTRTQGLGLLGAAFGLGFTVGPAIAGISLSLSNNNYHVPAMIAAGFSLLSIILTQFWFHETLTDEIRQQEKDREDNGFIARVMQALRNPVVALLLVLIFAQQLAFYSYENLFSLFTLNRLGLNAAGNAAIFVLVGILLVIVQGRAIGPLSKRFGDRNLIIAGLAFLGVGLVLSALTPPVAIPGYDRQALLQELANQASQQSISVTIPDGSQSGILGIAWILFASLPTVIGAGILTPSLNSMITKQVSPDRVGATLGVSAAFVSGANAITPIIGGAVFEWIGASAPFLIGGVLLITLVIPAMRIPRKRASATAA
ncbi:MAG: MFS transporter, partial [Anaerolineae bacterium]|nr:MFS transporter [Anaerolineae bacterium]